MKAVICGFVFGFVFLVVFLAGFGFGLEVRFMSRPVSVPSDRRELKCTCVPCLPDLYCLKCGHKSRDCPKLAAYFSKRGGAGGVLSSNAVQSVEGNASGGRRL